MDDPEYRLTLKVRNAKLARAISAAGFPSVKAFAASCGVQPVSLYRMLAFTSPPLTKNGDVRKPHKRVASALGTSVWHLWPEKFLDAVMLNHTATADVDEAALHSITQSPSRPDLLLERSDALSGLNELLGKIPERHRTVLKLRYGLDGNREQTLDEVANNKAIFPKGIHKEAVRQIELKALQKLKHHRNVPALKYALSSITAAEGQ